MRKKISYLPQLMLCVLLSAIGLLTSGCVTNNGDIGRLYGVWVLDSMEVDGEPYDGWRREGYTSSFFQFQNDICYVTRTNDMYDVQNVACTWKWVKEETLIDLNFTHTDNAEPEPGNLRYGPPLWLLLTDPGVYTFGVDWVTDKKMIWTTENSRGQKLTYHLSKNF